MGGRLQGERGCKGREVAGGREVARKGESKVEGEVASWGERLQVGREVARLWGGGCNAERVREWFCAFRSAGHKNFIANTLFNFRPISVIWDTKSFILFD